MRALRRAWAPRLNAVRATPQEYEKQAAAKRRALQILEIQREEEEWCVARGRASRAARRALTRSARYKQGEEQERLD